MESIQLKSYVGDDGVLRLQVPVGIRNQDLDVLVVLHPTAGQPEEVSEENVWPPGFFEATAGAFRDEPVERGEQGEYEVREARHQNPVAALRE